MAMPDMDPDRNEALAAVVAEQFTKAALPPNVRCIYNMSSADGVARGTVEFKSGDVQRFGVRVDHRTDNVASAIKVTLEMLAKWRPE
jgi:hypothetical protein